MTPDERFRRALSGLLSALDVLARPWMLIGGMAVIARGVPRHTTDIDATVWAPGLDVDVALAALHARGFLPRVADARQMAERAQILLLRHEPTGVGLDLSLAWLPFEEEALGAAAPIDFGMGLILPTANPEDLIIYKAVAWRAHDRTDIERLLMAHGADVNLTRIRRHVQRFVDVLEVPERMDEFEAVVRRALPPPNRR